MSNDYPLLIVQFVGLNNCLAHVCTECVLRYQMLSSVVSPSTEELVFKFAILLSDSSACVIKQPCVTRLCITDVVK